MPSRSELNEQAEALGVDHPEELASKAEVEEAIAAAEEASDEAAVGDTPSGKALAEVGAPGEDESDEQLNERAEAYAKAKAKERWGH